MNIYGVQKLTLLDFPEKVACIFFTGGCNFACPYCQNSSLIFAGKNYVWTEDEAFEFLTKRIGRLDGVCISGGEPLLNCDITEFISKIKEMGYAVKIDTNGSSPEKLKYLVKNGLVDYVAMDIKNSIEKYAQTIGRPNFDIKKVEESMDFLLQNHVEYEFRTTVVKGMHNEQDFYSIGKRLKGAKRFYLQAYKDSEDVLAKGLIAPSEEEMSEFAQILEKYIDNVETR